MHLVVKSHTLPQILELPSSGIVVLFWHGHRGFIPAQPAALVAGVGSERLVSAEDSQINDAALDVYQQPCIRWMGSRDGPRVAALPSSS